MNEVWSTGLALFLDRWVGDPRYLPHPVVVMGKWIAFVDRQLNTEHRSEAAKRFAGVLLTLSTISLASLLPWAALCIVTKYSAWIAAVLNVALIAATIAWKGLGDAGWAVYHKLRTDDIEAARSEVAMIVGRDTAHLSQQEVVRATVETVAENIVDAIVSPVLFACIGGAPGALLYRAANTLDSMVGYKNERYRAFGWFSARLDDVLNYIPARLTIALLWATIRLTGHDSRQAFRTLRRDSRKHPSPNSGIPESLVAGALGVELGGLNFYGGVPSFRPTMGEPLRPLEPDDIVRTIRIVNVACWLLLGLLAVGGGFLCWLR